MQLPPQSSTGTARQRLRRFALLAFCSISLLGLLLSRRKLFGPAQAPQLHFSDSEPLKECVSRGPRKAKPPAPINLWASLTVAETSEINSWLENPARNLNLTRAAANASASDNVVFIITAYDPPKAEALAYLSSPSTSSAPQRFARVTIHHGSDETPFVKDYLVGPLPVGPQTVIRRLTDIYHRPDIPYAARGFAFPIPVELTSLARMIGVPYADALLVNPPYSSAYTSC
jgi:primary-amine oxidase